MVYLLRSLLFLMLSAVTLAFIQAHTPLLPWSHIELAIIAYLLVIFIQAIVLFYFIGISRLTRNVQQILYSSENLQELFDTPPTDLKPYQKKVSELVYQTTLGKRQIFPWAMLMLVLGAIGFLLGGAHDTGMVSKQVHVGVIYGFIMAMIIGLFREWYYLGKMNHSLRQLKTLFEIPDHRM